MMVINCSIGYITINGKNARKHVTWLFGFGIALPIYENCVYRTDTITLRWWRWRCSKWGNGQCKNHQDSNKCVYVLGNSTNAWLQYSVQHVIVDKKWCHFFICETIILQRFAQDRKKNNKRFCHTALGTNAIIWIHIYWERGRESEKGRKKEKQSTSNYCWIIIFCAIFSILFW